MKHDLSLRKFLMLIAVILAVLAAGACTTPAAPTTEHETTEDHGHDEEGEDHEHEEDDVTTVPNNGAVIEIVSPISGAVFAAGEDIVVEIEVENFVLNEDGSHWHVYVDGATYAMVVGDTTTQVLRNLEPGEHTIGAFLANGDHIQLEEGSEVTITVSE